MTLTELLPTLNDNDKDLLTKLATALQKLRPVDSIPPEPKPETYEDIFKKLKPTYKYNTIYNWDAALVSSVASADYMVALTKLRNMADFYNQEPMWMPEAIMVAFQLCKYQYKQFVTVDNWATILGLPLFKRKEDALSALSKLTDEERQAVWGTKEMEL